MLDHLKDGLMMVGMVFMLVGVFALAVGSCNELRQREMVAEAEQLELQNTALRERLDICHAALKGRRWPTP